MLPHRRVGVGHDGRGLERLREEEVEVEHVPKLVLHQEGVRFAAPTRARHAADAVDEELRLGEERGLGFRV